MARIGDCRRGAAVKARKAAGVFSYRSLSSVGAVLAAALALTTGQALASAGCDAVNAGGFNGGTINAIVNTTIAGFAVGDRITFSINIPGLASWSLGAGTNTSNLDTANATSIHSYTVTGNQIAGQSDTTLTQARISPTVLEPLSVTATCTPAASNSNTDSQKLRALQIAASKLVAQTSGAAITGAIDGAIGDAFGNGGNPVSFGANGMTFNFTAAPRSAVAQRADQAFAALGYGALPSKAPPKQVIENDWSAWADVRGTGWDRNNTSTDLKGDQINVTAGLGRKLTPDLLIGLVTGYENFKYDSTLLAGTFKGDGWTIGGYGAWRFAPHWRFDAALAWSDISYDAAAGTAAGTFNGHRWLASTGLTGRYRFDALIVEPSSKVYALWERQNAWTDSLGTLQAARNFSAGRVATGGKVSYPWLTGNLTVNPYLGLYGDWRFSTDDALPAGQPAVGIGGGWSARLTGGVTMAKAGGAAVSLGGEYGGLGANYKVWSASGLVSWPF